MIIMMRDENRSRTYRDFNAFNMKDWFIPDDIIFSPNIIIKDISNLGRTY